MIIVQNFRPGHIGELCDRLGGIASFYNNSIVRLSAIDEISQGTNEISEKVRDLGWPALAPSVREIELGYIM